MTAPRPGYVLVSSHYAPLYRFGGPVRLAEQYAEVARSEGLSVRVLTLATAQELAEADGADAGARRSARPRDDVTALPLDRRSARALLRAIPAAFRRTRDHLAHHPAATLHVCEYRAPLTLGATLAMALRSGHVGIVHSAFGQLQPPSHWAKRVYDAIFRRLTRGMPYTVLVQNDHEEAVARAFFLGHRRLRITLLPLTTAGWADLPPAAPWADVAERRARARAALALPPSSAQDGINRPVLVFLGRWVREKGIERLLRAVAALPSDLQPTLLVAGADFGIGPRLRALAREMGLADRVRFEENVSDRRFDLYAAADVFTAFPVLYEETMLASIEALSVGTPILVSKEADVPFVQTAGAGAIIDFSQPAFETALRRLLSDPKASENARNAWVRWFTPQAQDATLRAVLRGSPP